MASDATNEQSETTVWKKAEGITIYLFITVKMLSYYCVITKTNMHLYANQKRLTVKIYLNRSAACLYSASLAKDVFT